MKKFVLVAHGRSGSTLFFDLISQHPDYDKAQRPENAEVLARKSFFPYLYLEYLSFRSSAKLFGVHIKVFDHLEKINNIYSPIDQVVFFNRLVKKGWKIIYIKRENILKIALSILVAAKRRKWSVKSTEELANHSLLSIDTSQLLRCMQITQLRQMRELNAISHVEFLPLMYEINLSKSESHQQTMNRVFEYLDISRNVKVEASLKKTSPSSYSSIISNFEEVVNFVESIPQYKVFLNDFN